MDGASPIIVASAVDQDYLAFALVIAASISSSTSGRRPVHYHVLYDGPGHWALRKLAAFRRNGVSVHLHRVTNRFAHLGALNGFPPATFMRAQIPEVLADIDRAIYLDCDAVVVDDLGDLYDAALAGRPIGGTQCVKTITAALSGGRTWSDGRWRASNEYFFTELGLYTREQQLGYVQCGVNLYDLRLLREEDYCSQMLAIAEARRDRLAFCDQCATNILLRGRIAPLDPRWNVTPFAIDPNHDERVPQELRAVMAAQRLHPGIVHFGGPKPWKRPLVEGAGQWWRAAAGSGALGWIIRRHGFSWLRQLVGDLARLYLPRPRRLIAWSRDRLTWHTSRLLQAARPRFPRSYAFLRSAFRAVRPLPPDRRGEDAK